MATTSSGRRAPRPATTSTYSTTGRRPVRARRRTAQLLSGPLGKAVIKTSAVKPQPSGRHRPGPSSSTIRTRSWWRSRTGELDGRDFVAVIRYQGPAANGMPELHKLTPALGVLQDRGQRVALVTDGRMSGASGKVPAAIHVTPEAELGGSLARVRDGDVITVDADTRGAASTSPTPCTTRGAPEARPRPPTWSALGCELFAAFRATVASADTGASVFRRFRRPPAGGAPCPARASLRPRARPGRPRWPCSTASPGRPPPARSWPAACPPSS